MDPNDARLYTIFSSMDSNAFQNAKASLNQYSIKFFASGEFKNDSSPFEIRVFGRDKSKAESLVKVYNGANVIDLSHKPKVNRTIAVVVVAIVAMIIMFVAGLLVFLMAM